jgi:hypothetical protein
MVLSHLISFDLPHGLGSVIGVGVILPLVVDQHLDQLVVHDLHVHLQGKDDIEDVLFFSLKKRPNNRCIEL